MNYLLILAFLFFCGSLIGWVLELFFRRFFASDNPERKWVNPGFLTGPYLPIYGLGLCALYSLASLEKLILIENRFVERGVLFVLMALAMTGIEYAGGLIFIKKMKIKLWDYSNEWGNIGGLICPKFSLIWAALGAVYYFAIHPFILDALGWLSRNLAFSFFIGFFFGVFAIDLAYSLRLTSRIRQFAEDNDIVVKYEEFKLHIKRSTEKRLEKYHFFRAFQTKTPLAEHLRSYKDLKLSQELRKKFRNRKSKGK